MKINSILFLHTIYLFIYFTAFHDLLLYTSRHILGFKKKIVINIFVI